MHPTSTDHGSASSGWLALRLALAHHPLCAEYRRDVFQAAGVRLCAGCVLFWPTFLIGAAAATLAAGLVPPLALVAGSTVLGGPEFIAKWTRLPVAQRRAAKVLAGLGLGALLVAILLVPLPLSLRLAALIALGVGLSFLLAVRLRSMLRRCDACPWHRRWDVCPGFENPPRSHRAVS